MQNTVTKINEISDENKELHEQFLNDRMEAGVHMTFDQYIDLKNQLEDEQEFGGLSYEINFVKYLRGHLG